jgi:predicted PhzF superfamily epimerase YddE/YHI9
MAVFSSEKDILCMTPDFAAVARLDVFGVIVTAPGSDCDFVSRFFAPGVGIPEDPVTGSAHCTLVPYWSERLGLKKLTARQLSKRRGELFCEMKGERISLAGRAAGYLQGKIMV